MPAMADATAWRRYAGNRRPVAVKQRVQEASVAHPERVGVKDRAKGATKRWFDDQSKHGGAKHRRWWRSSDCGGQNNQATWY